MPRDLHSMITAMQAAARSHAAPSETDLPAMDGGPVFRLADELGHGECGGWTAEQDGTPVCACGTELRGEGETAA